jgi:hypothetical protein
MKHDKIRLEHVTRTHTHDILTKWLNAIYVKLLPIHGTWFTCPKDAHHAQRLQTVTRGTYVVRSVSESGKLQPDDQCVVGCDAV